MSAFKHFSVEEFEEYIKKSKIKRKVKIIQLHHTYSPSYRHFNGENHESLQLGMKNYHVNTNGWSDIAQHFTIFPDGKILSGRNLEKSPAGIYGANTGAICIECVGNFDEGADTMTALQKDSVVKVIKVLLEKFNLSPEGGVTYHSWWTSSGKEIGDYIKGKSAKTCPGTAFFGGNTLSAYKKNLMPLIKSNTHSNLPEEITELNDIIQELSNAGIITDKQLWLCKCNEDVNVYWLCRKMANKIKNIA